MKQSDIISIAMVAIIGFVFSYFIVDMLIDLDSARVSYKTIVSISEIVEMPSPDMFNANAINPTMEVTIGETSCDFNKDGVVSEQEKAMCKECDTDGDGVMNEDERKKCEERIELTERSGCDLDGNGRIDDDERLKCVLCDFDGNGRIDDDEKEICETER